MEEIFISRPEIAIDDFMVVFFSGALTIIFAGAYVCVFALVKIKKLKNYFMPIAYLFWVLTVLCLYVLSDLIGNHPFTQKVLFMTMLAYLFFPHFIFFLMDKSHENHEHEH